MSVSILHGTGRLFCDGLDKGENGRRFWDVDG